MNGFCSIANLVVADVAQEIGESEKDDMIIDYCDVFAGKQYCTRYVLVC